ncbi:hypothetical protein L5876_14695, partial [Hyphobacterium sp. SN044]|uniref:hypothetical protein n=1 Tax=Hyphobacterium sp. SN044 TaxID=2912575 RepID=UPI001F16C47E
MTTMRLLAIIAIYICTTIGWMILGGVTSDRTRTTHNDMKQEVADLYGGNLSINTPSLYYIKP